MRIRRLDLGTAFASMVVSFLLVDLFFGVAVLVALLVGGMGLVEVHRQRKIGRTLVGISVGMLLAAAVLVLLAGAHRL